MPSRGERVGDAQRDVHVGAVGNDREVAAGAAQRRRSRAAAAAAASPSSLLDARIAIERDVLVVEDRIGIGDGAAISARASCGVDGTTIFRPGVR